jgi:hypothetical protein
MIVTLPAAVYEKKVDQSDKTPGQYRWQRRDAAFPDVALKIADDWCQRFQWNVAQEQAHEPVAMWLILGPQGRDGVLMLRFLDIGQDDRGRWGTLRLEAAYSTSDWQECSPNLPAIFLAQAVKHESLLCEITGTKMTLDDNALDSEEIKRIVGATANTVKTVILASHDFGGFSLSGSQGLLLMDAGTWAPTQIQPLVSVASSKSEKPQSVKSPTTLVSWSRKKKKRIPWGTLATVMLTALVVGWLAYFAWEMKGEVENKDAELVQKSNDINSLKKTKASLEETNADLAEQLLSEKERAEKVESELLRVTTTLNEKNEKISIMREGLESDVQSDLQRLQELNMALEILMPLLEKFISLADEAQGSEIHKAMSKIRSRTGAEGNK